MHRRDNLKTFFKDLFIQDFLNSEGVEQCSPVKATHLAFLRLRVVNAWRKQLAILEVVDSEIIVDLSWVCHRKSRVCRKQTLDHNAPICGSYDMRLYFRRVEDKCISRSELSVLLGEVHAFHYRRFLSLFSLLGRLFISTGSSCRFKRYFVAVDSIQGILVM